jgi:hypothetical protein
MTIFRAACTIRSRTARIDSRRRSPEPGFARNTRRGAASGSCHRKGPARARRAAGQSRTARRRGWSVGRCRPRRGCGAPAPRPLQDVPAEDLVIERVRPSARVGLGRPVERSLQFSDSILLAVLASTDTRLPFPTSNARTKQRPFPRPRLCCPAHSSGTTAASDAHPALAPFPVIAGYRASRSGGIRSPPGRGESPQFPPSPSERSAPSTPGSSSGPHFQALHPFHGLRPEGLARLFLLPTGPGGGTLTARQASRNAADPRSVPPTGLLTLRFATGRFPPTTAACYRASWQLPGPDSHRQATTSLRWITIYTASTSNSWAHSRFVEVEGGVSPVRPLVL